MIPSVVEAELRDTILDYLQTTFSFQDADVAQALDEFLTDETEGIFKGPYVQLRLPYRRADKSEAQRLLDVRPPFTPYVHQVEAFRRLTSENGHEPRPTIVTTGTGSGKTECFLFPILDHCFRRVGKKGVKALILYPMNALAEDQSGRFAEWIWKDERLRGKVTAGMYVGGKGRFRTMGSKNVITDRETLRRHPPDILLTNYKMLDFLLLRPEDEKIWKETGPDSLRYLVLDELHTYDGAQGSDVACLIRRLRAKLRAPAESMCCVGTSATLAGDQAEAITDLVDFAAKIFGIAFDKESVISEDRLEMSEYLGEEGEEAQELPRDVPALRPRAGDDHGRYLERQAEGWLGDGKLGPLEVGRRLARHGFLRTLLLNVGGKITEWRELIERLARWDPAFAELSLEDRDTVLRSFLALVSRARREEAGREEPFLSVQLQLWVRELRRLVRRVSKAPGFFWRDKVPLKSITKGLPAVYCRVCGASGWVGFQRRQDTRARDDLEEVYRQYFDRTRHVRYYFPGRQSDDLFPEYLCPRTLTVSDKEKLSEKGPEGVPVLVSSKKSSGHYPRDLQHCPFCESDFSLSLVSSQAASLSSVAISHLYLSRFNTEKKLIAFTDSVQDASHRAGFFGARTYRFNLRTAIQTVLEADEEGVIRLSELTDRFLEYWSERMEARELVASFLPEDLRDLAEYRSFLETAGRRFPKKLAAIVRKRLSWEIVMEYGFSARVGRTLDKVCCSTAFLDEAKLVPALEKLAAKLRNEIAPLAETPPERLRHFVVGLLTRTRVRGGVSHEMLRRYAEERGNRYFLSQRKQPYMSPFGPQSRLPRFLSRNPGETVFDSAIASGSAYTWYLDWAKRCLLETLDLPTANDVYRLTLDTLAEAGLLELLGTRNTTAYSIPQEALLVTRHAAGVRSPEDGQDQTVSRDEVSRWLGMPSLGYRASGTYAPDDRREQSYYREVYRSGVVRRIFSSEHSGLLARESRERVEDLFKTGREADSPNLLTCTPTLELGIDIGDLSSTMLCSIPPDPTNYLQRIGRAGRVTGNSLILAMANVRPHDLYFFSNPFEMVAGLVTPPGCFLDAPEMLKRQYVAFCLDSWCRDSPDARDEPMPNKVMILLARNRRGEFPRNFLRFVENHREELFETFFGLFGNQYVSQEGEERLRSYALSDAVRHGMERCLERAQKEVDDLRRRRKLLKDRRDRIEADRKKVDEAEEAIRDLNREMFALGKMISDIQNKYPLNLFTDEGLLPNYAFPETGVTLRSVIYGKQSDGRGGREGGGNATSTETHEYVRGAREAIRDLAPFNTFYAEARKVVIRRVETGGRSDSLFQDWRFCPRCTHMRLEVGGIGQKTCPHCGSAEWEDVGQKHALLKLEKVFSASDHIGSRTGDETDDRERKTYLVMDFIDAREENWGGGYADEGGSFGIEYLKEVSLRELNFGPKDTRGQKFKAGGEEIPEAGFSVCADCGVVRDPQKDPNETRHSYWCYYHQGNRRPDWRAVFLYREVRSEAIRILLPFSTFEVSERRATFQACLELGLRRKFKGNPQHLIIREHTDPGIGGDPAPKRFLVLYDNVPGGTGYLKEFAKNPAAFRDVLEEASRALKSCACGQREEEDGCYRCVYAYRRQYQLELVSRRLGIEMLESILKRWQHLTEVQTLATIDVADWILESELEHRFVVALGAHLTKKDIPWKKVLANGKPCHEFPLGGRIWRLEPQVDLGLSDNVTLPSRPDFLIRPVRGEAGVLPVAVFLDGFAHHVQPTRNPSRLLDDVKKRSAILRSKRFLVWSLTWDDVAEFESDPESSGVNLLAQLRVEGGTLKKILANANSPLKKSFVRRSAISGLLDYLRTPDVGAWRQAVAAAALVATMPAPPFAERGSAQRAARHLLREENLEPAACELEKITDIDADGACLAHLQHDVGGALLLAVDKEAADELRPGKFHAILRLEDAQESRAHDGYKEAWREILGTANLLQFLPQFRWTSTQLIAEQTATGTLAETDVPTIAVPEAEPEPAPSGELEEAMELADPSLHELLAAVGARGRPLPEVGYELPDTDGRTCAEAELGWPEKKVAVLLAVGEEFRPVFEDGGWRVFAAEDIQKDNEALLDAIRE